MRNRLLFPLLLATSALLILASPLLLAEPDESDQLPTASVTTGKLEAKVAEAEAASDMEEEARKQLLDLYGKALDMAPDDTNKQRIEGVITTLQG